MVHFSFIMTVCLSAMIVTVFLTDLSVHHRPSLCSCPTVASGPGRREGRIPRGLVPRLVQQLLPDTLHCENRALNKYECNLIIETGIGCNT